ncbi:MAG: aminotransferase class I/II-fold pyridoxal phosphate-dependent enzyme [Bacteroidia bacterium]|nr:aminotransferase class I/II-fold pyridoxal phosphate-dependent enzyme [Bacteroidia bacterium]
MSKITAKNINTLINAYQNFCDSVKYRSHEDFYTKDNKIIELSYNENPLGPGEKARTAIKYYSQYAHLYPPIDYSILINKLSENLSLLPDNLIISAGSVAAIYLAVFQHANKGDKIIISKSSMPWYKWSILANNSIPVEVPLLPDMNHDLESILKSINNKTKIIILSNPHNPTGLYINEEMFLDFFKKIPENVLLILDQAYYEYQNNQEKIFIDTRVPRKQIDVL